MRRISCGELWKEWTTTDESDIDIVAIGQEKIKTMSPTDWDNMVIGGHKVVEKFKYVSDNNFPVDSIPAKESFDYMVQHISTWFFEPNSYFIKQLSKAVHKNPKYIFFFNQWSPGIYVYLRDLFDYWGPRMDKV